MCRGCELRVSAQGVVYLYWICFTVNEHFGVAAIGWRTDGQFNGFRTLGAGEKINNVPHGIINPIWCVNTTAGQE